MRINHRGADVLMPEQFLNRPNIIAILKQVSRERMAEGVTTGRLAHPRPAGGFFDGLLYDRLVQMVLVPFAGDPIPIVL